MISLIVWLTILTFIGWLGMRYVPMLLGTSLPPGYTMRAESPGNFSSPVILVCKGEERIFESSSISVYGYRSCARAAGRAAWTHYTMTKTSEVRDA